MSPDRSPLDTRSVGEPAGKVLFLVCILLVVLASLLASLIQRSGGRVKVIGIKIPTQNGQWVVADLFKPRTATEENPAPLVVVVLKTRWRSVGC